MNFCVTGKAASEILRVYILIGNIIVTELIEQIGLFYVLAFKLPVKLWSLL